MSSYNESDQAQLPEASEALSKLVDNTGQSNQEFDAHTTSDKKPNPIKHPWLHKLIPALEKFAAKDHVGNWVVQNRGDQPQKQFESMPIYVRLGMHLLFVTGRHFGLAERHKLEELLKSESIKQGKLFDSESGAQERIQNFIKEYDLTDTLPTLLQPDPKQYKTFNEFFYRKLKSDARPIHSPQDPNIITSAADCRLTVWSDISIAQKFWVKGSEFNIQNLLQDRSISDLPQFKDGACLAIFRLAPADYHRFHSPVTATIGPVNHIQGQYFTVNPQAVNENFNVFTENKRDVALLNVTDPNGGPSKPIVYVAVGAMLVGSINWTRSQGDQIDKGQELGYFAYGGSTIITIFPKASVRWDQDLLRNSQNVLETMVKAGERIGQFL